MNQEIFKTSRQVFMNDAPYVALGDYPYYDTPVFFEQLHFEQVDDALVFMLEDNHLTSFFRSLSACDFLVGNGWIDLAAPLRRGDDYDEFEEFACYEVDEEEEDNEGLAELAAYVGRNLAYFMQAHSRLVYNFVGYWAGKSGYFHGVDGTWEEVERQVTAYYPTASKDDPSRHIHQGQMNSQHTAYAIVFPETYQGDQSLQQIFIEWDDFDLFLHQVTSFLEKYLTFLKHSKRITQE